MGSAVGLCGWGMTRQADFFDGRGSRGGQQEEAVTWLGATCLVNQLLAPIHCAAVGGGPGPPVLQAQAAVRGH